MLQLYITYIHYIITYRFYVSFDIFKEDKRTKTILYKMTTLIHYKVTLHIYISF